MNILVLGAGGMAGHLVATYLREQGHSVDTLSGKKSLDKNTVIMDILDKNAFENFLNTHKYDAIINCIGILVKQSEARKDLSTYLNSFLPHFLEMKYAGSDTKIVHLSTDCVFSGKNAPYKEDSPYDGELYYDRTKALGEIVNDKDLTFRMSIIGPEIQEDGIGLFNWFMKQDGNIQGYTASIWNGITTLQLAKGIEAALSKNLTGLYHLVPDKNISKYDLLCLIKDVFKKDNIKIDPVEGLVVDKTLLNTRKDFDFSVPSYEVMIADLSDWIDDHKSMYRY